MLNVGTREKVQGGSESPRERKTMIKENNNEEWETKENKRERKEKVDGE